MTNFEVVEKYFNDKQTEFLEALNKRGFIINPTAKFEAQHSTGLAIPILMNPYSYDKWISSKIFTLTNPKFINWYPFQILRMNSELQYAFSAKNYNLNIIGPFNFYYPIRGGKIWITELGRNEIFSFDDLRNNFLLGLQNFDNIYVNTVTNILVNIFQSKFRGENYKSQISAEKLKEIFINLYDPKFDFVSALFDVLHSNYPVPRLTIIHDLIPHNPFIYDENGLIVHDKDNMNPLDYLSQHIWSGKVLINVIDMILEVDPDAVIVIQSDHGLHGNTEEDFKKAFGEKADTRELWNSTMSAMRVPQKFQTGEEHYAMETPLNITRYLVNTFVGKNYEYISADVAY